VHEFFCTVGLTIICPCNRTGNDTVFVTQTVSVQTVPYNSVCKHQNLTYNYVINDIETSQFNDVCGNLIAEIVGSNPSRGMNVCLLNVCVCVCVCVCVDKCLYDRPIHFPENPMQCASLSAIRHKSNILHLKLISIRGQTKQIIHRY
jgi:hypothetical protein